MVKHMRVAPHGVLEEAHLRDLGRLNVICGRNNSGKTTLLTNLASEDRVSAGAAISAQDIEKFVRAYASGDLYRREDRYTAAGRELISLTESVLREKPVWFASDESAFADAFVSNWKKFGGLRPYTVDGRRLVNSFHILFPKLPPRLLIPAKRHLELVSAFIAKSSTNADGTGLLNHLFQCKNQEKGEPQRQLFEAISQAFERISGGYSFDIISGGGTAGLLLRLRTPQGKSANAADCGLGMQDLLILLYFALDTAYGMVLVEEPESHLHPEMQRKLLQFMAERMDKQFIFSTHSNVFLDGAFVDRVFFTSYNGTISVRDETSRALLLSDLGYQVSDNLVSDLIVLVEGPKDVPILEAFLQKLGYLGEFSIKFWPLGGDIMDQLDLSVFAERYRIVALIDRDPKSDAIRKRFIKQCEEVNIEVHRLERYAIENYLSLPALRQVFGQQVRVDLESIRPDTSVESQLGFSVKRRSREVARAMEVHEFDDTDLGQFVKKLGEQLRVAQAIQPSNVGTG